MSDNRQHRITREEERELSLYTYSAPARVWTRGAHFLLRWLTRALWIGGIVIVAGLLLAPWQQSVVGNGRVVAYAPTDRTQSIEAPIKGRVMRWHVQEGTKVEKGDPIADIADNDPRYLDRLNQERLSVTQRVNAASNSIAIAESRLTSLRAARNSAIANAELYIQIAGDKYASAKQDMEAAAAEYETAKLNQERQSSLGRDGLVSTRKVEVTALKLRTSENKKNSARAKVRAAARQVRAATAKRSNISSKEDAYIQKAEESLQKLRSELAKAQGDMAKMEVKVARQQSMSVVAPLAGTVLRLVANGPGEVVKAGDMIAQIVPNTTSRAVELWVGGNDAPLVTPGRQVRLQFEGWPAVQFVGWPSVAVGTFGGTVAFVDATDDGLGRFRVVVVPDSDDAPWPDARYLRQGVRANGWLLLNRVSVAFELWRQLNGFPPVTTPPGSASGKPAKKGKK